MGFWSTSIALLSSPFVGGISESSATRREGRFFLVYIGVVHCKYKDYHQETKSIKTDLRFFEANITWLDVVGDFKIFYNMK